MEADHLPGTGRAAREGGPYECCVGAALRGGPAGGKSQGRVSFFLPLALWVPRAASPPVKASHGRTSRPWHPIPLVEFLPPHA